jgi:hypothetical protein
MPKPCISCVASKGANGCALERKCIAHVLWVLCEEFKGCNPDEHDDINDKLYHYSKYLHLLDPKLELNIY